MLIKCQVCDHENQLGNIFCRNCGVKLDLDKMSPDQFKNIKKKKGNPVKDLISLAFLLIVVLFFTAAFLPFGHGDFSDPEEELRNEAIDKVDALALMAGSRPRGNKNNFTGQELSAYLNKIVGGGMSTESPFLIQKVLVSLKDPNKVKIKLKTKFYENFPVVLTLSGTIEPKAAEGEDAEAADGFTFNPKSAAFGYIPLLFGLEKFVLEPFKPLADENVLVIADNSQSMNIEDSTLYVELKGGRR